MKLKCSSLKAVLAATALLCLSSADSWAKPPRARELCGVIQTINPHSRTLTIQSPKRDQPFTFAVKDYTRFIKNWKFTDSGSLKEGQRACVYYRSPLFGKPFVTKVVWTQTNREKPDPGRG